MMDTIFQRGRERRREIAMHYSYADVLQRTFAGMLVGGIFVGLHGLRYPQTRPKAANSLDFSQARKSSSLNSDVRGLVRDIPPRPGNAAALAVGTSARAGNVLVNSLLFFALQELVSASQLDASGKRRTRAEGAWPLSYRLTLSPAQQRAVPSLVAGGFLGWVIGGVRGIHSAALAAPLWAVSAATLHWGYAEFWDPNETFEPYVRRQLLRLVVREIDREEAEDRREKNAQYFVYKPREDEHMRLARERAYGRVGEESLQSGNDRTKRDGSEIDRRRGSGD